MWPQPFSGRYAREHDDCARLAPPLSTAYGAPLSNSESLFGSTYMKTKNINWRLLAGLVILSGAAVNAATAGTAEQDVTAAENQMVKALQANNVDLASSMVADKYVQTDSDGVFIAGKAAGEADAKAYTFSKLDLSDLKVTAYGDTAIATGAFASKGTYKGKAFDDRGRFTDTWVKLDGKWQLVATQNTRIKK